MAESGVFRHRGRPVFFSQRAEHIFIAVLLPLATMPKVAQLYGLER